MLPIRITVRQLLLQEVVVKPLLRQSVICLKKDFNNKSIIYKKSGLYCYSAIRFLLITRVKK